MTASRFGPTETDHARSGGIAFRATPSGMGPVAVIELSGATGEATSALVATLAGRDVEVGRLALRDLAGIDRGLVARFSGTRAQLMPHGGTRIVELLAERLASLGVAWIDDPLDVEAGVDPALLYPEAEDRIEALALAACARAESPRAAALLLAQPARWRGFDARTLDAADLVRAGRLARLIVPPTVALVGRPNAGKSTLSNALLGREGSIASPEPGTTRDAVSTRVDLDGLVVEWLDLPGLRETDDPIEGAAIALADGLLRRADLVVALAAPGIGWPDAPRAPEVWVPEVRIPEVRVYAKIDAPESDRDPIRGGSDLAVSARTGEGIEALQRLLRSRLVPDADLESPRPWVFDPRVVVRAP